MQYQDLAPLVAIDAMSAPMPRVINAIGQAANEFYRRTLAYKLMTPEQDVTQLQRRVGMLIPATTILAGVLSVKFNGAPIYPASALPNDWENLAGTPRNYIVGSAATDQDYVDPGYLPEDYLVSTLPSANSFDGIRLVPYMSQTEPNAIVIIEYGVTPKLDATALPDGVGYRYSHALVSGAKSYLLNDVDKAWSNQNAAALYRAQFEAEINKGILDARAGADPTKRMQVRMRRL